MADKMMRIAARKDNGTAAAVRSDVNGNVGTVRVWKKTWTTIEENIELRDTNEYKLAAFDARNIPVMSLRFINRLGVPVTMRFLTDVNTTNGYGIYDKDAAAITITIQPTNHYMILTPDELPILNYLQYVRLAITATSAPSSGSFGAYVVSMT